MFCNWIFLNCIQEIRTGCVSPIVARYRGPLSSTELMTGCPWGAVVCASLPVGTGLRTVHVPFDGPASRKSMRFTPLQTFDCQQSTVDGPPSVSQTHRQGVPSLLELRSSATIYNSQLSTSDLWDKLYRRQTDRMAHPGGTRFVASAIAAATTERGPPGRSSELETTKGAKHANTEDAERGTFGPRS